MRDAEDEPLDRKGLRFLLREALNRLRPRAARDALIVRAGDATLDRGALRFTAPPRPPVHLTPIEARLLERLMRDADMTVPREALREQIEGDDTVGPPLVDIAVQRLRAKIEQNADRPEWIETVPGVGYRFRSRRDRR